MKIGIFTDPHCSSEEIACSTRRPSLSFGKIRTAMTRFKEENVSLVLCLGDMMNAREPELLSRLSEMIRSFGIPFFCLMGNHDYYDFSREEFSRLTGNAYPPFTLTAGGRTLIFPDANYLDDGRLYNHENLDWTNSFLPEDQLEKLRSVLADPSVTEAYVFLHQNIDPDVEKHHIIRNAAEIRDIITQSGKVKEVYGGHYHPGHENVIGGIPCHTLPAMCEGEAIPFVIAEI